MAHAIGALMLSGLLAGLAQAGPLSNAPVDVRPAPEAFSEVRYGLTVLDPFRWMEQPARAADMAAFVRAASAHTVAELAALPQRAAFAATLEATLRAGVRYSDVKSAGPALLYRRQDPEDRTARLVVRQAGLERVLLALTDSSSDVAAISNYTVSRDGRTVAVHVAKAGAEVGETRFIDVATARTVAPAIGPIWGEFSINWLAGRHIAYTRMAASSAGSDPMQNMQAMVTTVGAGPGRLLLGSAATTGPAADPQDFPLISTSAISPWAMGLFTGARADARYFVAREQALLAGQPRWREIATLADQVSDAVLRGDAIFLLSSKQHPNGAVLRRRLTAGGAGEPVTVLAGSDFILTGLAATADGLYVSAHQDGVSRLLYLPHGGGKAQALRLPIEGDLSGLVSDGDGGSVTFGLNGWLTDRAYYRARRGKVEPLGLASAGWAGALAFSTQREEAVSADGTRVPMVVLLPKGGKPAGGGPTILAGYGSYGQMSVSPWYSPAQLAWLAHGGTVAFCGTRGGSERGRPWHDAGRAANKPNAQADYIACAERLIQTGHATARSLVATGTSAGGLLVPPAALKRPELFTAVVPRVAILNPTRFEAAENGANQYAEMGDPRTENGFLALLAQDAYALAADAVDAPDMLLTVGLNDKRVAPWMAAKFAARSLQRFGDRRLVLVRADAAAGHGIGSSRDNLIAEWADVFSFAWNRASGP